MSAAFFAVALLALPAVAGAQLRAVPVVSGLQLPIEFAQDPSNPSIQYIAEQQGTIRVIKDGALLVAPFLDIRTLVTAGGERGLLGLAFPRDYGLTRRFYVYYTRQRPAPDDGSDIFVVRYLRSAIDPLRADPASARRLVFHSLDHIPHPQFQNHNGGHMAFGPDGYLYIGLGDGGGGDDPFNNAQTPATLLGKIIRIDVGVSDGDPEGYNVPPDNPFVGSGLPGVLPEIWAFGVRNPWKFSFDEGAAGTNALIIGDVGQGDWEEIDYEPANRGGRNYGWRVREGAHDHLLAPPPSYLPLSDPVHEYDHSIGSSITGGYVYRGTAMSQSQLGRYFFADFVRGRVWSVGLSIGAGGEGVAAGLVEHTSEFGGTSTLGSISSFGRDARGELYLVSYTGTIFQIVDLTAPPDIDTVIFNFNGDPFSDVLRYHRATGAWSIWLGSAAGTFRAGPAGGWSPGWQIFVANFDADGFEDLFLYSQTTGVWVKVMNSGSSFSYFSQGWRAGFSIVVADLDGDRRSDIFLYDPATGLWVSCLTVGDGTVGFSYVGGGWRPGFALLPADFDGDGKRDFLLYDSASGLFCKALTRAPGLFLYLCGGWRSGWQTQIADIDGDGLSDVFLYDIATGIFVRATSTGDGTSGFDYVSGGWAGGWTVRTAMFDGNSSTDFFLYNFAGTWVKVINSGAAFSYVSGGWAIWTTEVRDLNGDGRDDVFLLDRMSGIWFQALTTTPGAFAYSTGRFPQ